MIPKTLVPIALAVISLILFNVGLYWRLSAEPSISQLTLPYRDEFVSPEFLQFPRFGGDWDIRDESLVQISTTGFDLGILIPLEIANDLPYHFSSDLRYLGGSMGGGIIFNSQNGQNRQQSHMVRFNVDGDKMWLIYGYFGDDSNFTGQGSVELSLAPENGDWQNLGVYVDQQTYSISLNGVLVAENITLQYRGGTVGLISSASQVAFDNLVVEAWSGNPSEIASNSVTETVDAATTEPAIVPTDIPSLDSTNSEILFQDQFDGTASGESRWLPFSGQWRFADGSLLQEQQNGFDLAAGYNLPFGDATVTAIFRHLQGQGAGILFKMEQPDSLLNAHMARYVHDSNFLMWGYFDAAGNFQGQGSAQVPAPANVPHQLSVTVQNGAYSLLLDGQLVVESVPLMTQGNYYGLISAQTSVAFDDFVVSASNAVQQSTPTDAITLNAVTGDWEFGETVVQRATDPVDYIAGTGVAAETFRVSVTVTLPPNVDDAGAGLVFHMQGRDDISGGQMIRFASGGREIFWGYYDDNRIFSGLGGAPLNLDWSQPHQLTLIVQSDGYDVLIDGTVLVTNLPVQNSFGWIGLVSYRGEVIFSDFALSMGQ